MIAQIIHIAITQMTKYYIFKRREINSKENSNSDDFSGKITSRKKMIVIDSRK
ncbi:10060_t:CDS:2 [Gigaspora rosea]|nr:10060_t:CDS:2 [Gigaspora rosea]